MKTLGQIYQERVLSRSELARQRLELNQPVASSRIEKGLFGWQLFYTRLGSRRRYSVQCVSELRARYLKMLIDIGISEIYIPSDENYLSEVLLELETLKRKIDDVIDHYTTVISSPRIKERIRRGVYTKMIKV